MRVSHIEKKSFLYRFLDRIEKIGNALPHPAFMFFVFISFCHRSFLYYDSNWTIGKSSSNQ
jgi:p-aminobenzoyl-glutamate transporter AbgT